MDRRLSASKTDLAGTNIGSQLGCEMVTFLVGTEARLFRVHKELLCSRVDHFRAMFTPGFPEGSSNQATLSEDDPDAFILFLDYLYRGSFELSQDDHIEDDLTKLIWLYAFADRTNQVTLADITIDLMVKICKTRGCQPMPCQMDLGYELTPEGSKLRSFLSRACVFVILSLPGGGTDHPDFTAEKMVPVLGDNEDLLADVFALLRGKGFGPVKNPLNGKPCDYHMHGPDVPCAAELEEKEKSPKGPKTRGKKRLRSSLGS